MTLIVPFFKGLTPEEEEVIEQQIESGEEEPERPVVEERFESPGKERQEDTEGDGTERQGLEDEGAVEDEDILSVKNADIEEQQTESGREEPERPVEEERREKEGVILKPEW